LAEWLFVLPCGKYGASLKEKVVVPDPVVDAHKNVRQRKNNEKSIWPYWLGRFF
jgi:hypothetical protein